MRDSKTLVREAALKSGATRNGEKLERGPRSLVALLQSAYLTTAQVTHRIRVCDRATPETALPPKFLQPLIVMRKRSRRTNHS
jgi:hypothetical protein